MHSLRKWLGQRRKAVVAIVGALATWAVTYFPNSHWAAIGGVVVAILGALGVYQIPNDGQD